MPCRVTLWGMENSGWALLGTLVRQRREYLGLKQGDLAHYGGPAVSTVGKVERGEQQGYPTRTQHQIENALGWARGEVRRIIEAPESEWWDDEGIREDFIATLVEEGIPDLSRPTGGPIRSAADLSDDELLAELTYRMKRYANEREEESDGRAGAATTRAGVSPALIIGGFDALGVAVPDVESEPAPERRRRPPQPTPGGSRQDG